MNCSDTEFLDGPDLDFDIQSSVVATSKMTLALKANIQITLNDKSYIVNKDVDSSGENENGKTLNREICNN